MEQFALTGASANAVGRNTVAEIAGLEVNYSSGCLSAELLIREGNESLLSVYGIAGQLKFRKKILNPGIYEFAVDLKKGAYVVTLISGKSWAARRVNVN
ncbi:MAG: hypothetical protein MUE37_13600 [Bacteroidales bacterium]|jgi:hypothetical protein|nr:hypothetical protein [Bacteroidales bacterium]